MTLQYPDPYNPYQEPSKPRNLPALILISLGILTLILVAYFTYSHYGKRGDNNSSEGIAVGEPNPNSYDCTRDVYNCNNFTTQSEAQVAFDSCFKNYGDAWNLDNDGDGNVCE